MEGLILGFDLGDDYSQISCFNRRALDAELADLGGSERARIPSVVCKKNQEDVWLVGDDAKAQVKSGAGILVDRLVRMVEKEGAETIEGIRYSAASLLERFLAGVLAMTKSAYQVQEIESLVFTLQNPSVRLMDIIVVCMDHLGVPRRNVHILSRSEGFLYYVLSQKKDIWNNMVALFDLSDEGLYYYELAMLRGQRPQIAKADCRKLEESFSLDILEKESGCKMADKILCACSARQMQKKVYSAVLLSGKGFMECEWAQGFIRTMGNRRKLFLAPGLFAMGAAYKAYDYVSEMSLYPYTGICEGTLSATVSLDVQVGGKEKQLILASAGDNWYEARTKVELILDHLDCVELNIMPAVSRQLKQVTIPLTGFPNRPPKTTRVEIMAAFTNKNCMHIRIKDKGFGELFPASEAVIQKDILLEA